MIRITHAALLACALALCAVPRALARTWTVDDDLLDEPHADFTNVQSAINAAANGDTILVHPGIYRQPLTIPGKAIRLTSTAPGDPFTAEKTILSAARTGRVITLSGAEPPECVIEGFTIRDGVAEIGGGIYGGEARSSATIRHNIIRHNSGDEGGGIANSTGLIAGNSIVENGAIFGGALFQCGGRMYNNEIRDNIALEGGGLYKCAGNIQKNLIAANFASLQGGAFARCIGFVDLNVITENHAPEGGAFIFCGGRIADNHIAFNTATFGGAFYSCQGTIERNTIVKNGAGEAGGAFFGGSGLVQNNIVVANYSLRDGGGFAQTANANVLNNRVHFNVALEDGGGFEGCTGAISGNDLLGNTAERGGAFANCNARIDSNTIGRNEGLLGGAAFGCSGTFQNNLVQGNIASRGQALDRCFGLIQNNTFAFNASDPGTEDPVGGALFVDEGGTTLRNNIFYRNADVEILLARIDPNETAKLFFQNNNFHNPGHPLFELSDRTRSFSTVRDFEKAYPHATGNMQANPLFVREAGPDGNPAFTEDNDMRLKPGSPCIDAGRIEVMATMPVRDLAGNARFHNAAADIGCYEFGSAADADGDGLADSIEAGLGLNSASIDTDGDGLTDAMELVAKTDPLVANAIQTRVLSPGASLQELILKSVRGDTITIMPGVYYGSNKLMGKALRILGSKPTDPATVAATILDGAGTGGIIELNGEEGTGTAVEGLTLQYGHALNGAAIFGADLPVTVRHCDFRNNLADNAGAVARLSGEIAFCRFLNNGAGFGAAIADCRSSIINNTFEHNRAGLTGGALFQCFGPIANNVFHANQARQGGAASVIFGEITANTFTSNTATFGAGIFNASKPIKGNQFLHNAGRDGGALLLCRGRVEANDFIGNIADTGAALRGFQGEVVGNRFIGNFARVNGGAIYGSLGTFDNNLFEGNSSFGGGAMIVCGGDITASVFRNNSAETDGGAVASCNGDLIGNIFQKNRARNGGAVFDHDGDIIDNAFRFNAASGSGGALMRGEGALERNVFLANTALDGGALRHFTGRLLHNRLQGNSAAQTGGALADFNGLAFGNLFQRNAAASGAAARGGRADYLNNTLANNVAPAGGVLHDVTTGTIGNNIFAANTGVAFIVPVGEARPAGVRANAFWQNSNGTYAHFGRDFASVAALEAALPEASGNFEFDPRFVAPTGPDGNLFTLEDNDLRLAPGSPAIDRGLSFADSPAVDLDGGPRLASGGRISKAAIDLGAFEFLSITLFNPEAPIFIRGGDSLSVRWLADPKVAGPAIRFEMFDNDSKVAILANVMTADGVGTAPLVIPSYLWQDRPYLLRATSTSNPDIWTQSPGTITLKAGGDLDSMESPDTRSAADSWLYYN